MNIKIFPPRKEPNLSVSFKKRLLFSRKNICYYFYRNNHFYKKAWQFQSVKLFICITDAFSLSLFQATADAMKALFQEHAVFDRHDDLLH